MILRHRLLNWRYSTSHPLQALAIVGALLASLTFLVLVEYHTLRQQLAEQLREQLQIISENAAASLLFMDKAAARQILSTLAVNSDINCAVIYNEKREVFAVYLARGVTMEPLEAKNLNTFGLQENMDATHLSLPIYSEGAPIGHIYSVANLDRLYRHLFWYGCSTALVLLGTVGVAYIILRRLSRAVEEARQRIGYIESYDPITLLPNRYAFNQHLDKQLSSAVEGKSLGLLVLDLDDFKVINDSLGHHVGDRLLGMVAQRLSLKLNREDMIYRVGGDEFAMLVEYGNTPNRVTKLAQRMLEAFSLPFELEGRNVYVGVSVGASVYPQDGKDAASLFRAADAAMYSAKNRGKSQFQLFSSEMHDKSKARLGLETELREAIEQSQFELYYQPQYHLKTGTLVGAEALLRWRHPKRGLVSPLSFIPVAEECGLIVPIGEWVIRTACYQLKYWQDEGLRPIRVSLNLSARQFRETGLLDTIANILLETDISPDLLEMEITESMLMDDMNTTVKRLESLRLMGIHLAIDDFGTGYSSLSYLKRFPVGRIKIDRSFIQDIPHDADDVAITIATINMAQSLGLELVAEGVETKEQRDFLANQNCEIGQGYLFSKPVDSAFMTLLLRTSKVDSPAH